MASHLISELETQRALEALKRPGPDGLFPKVFKPFIASALFWMFNLSLQPSWVPDGWHRATFTRVPDAQWRTTDPNARRPIYITPFVCKVLETILNVTIFAHLS